MLSKLSEDDAPAVRRSVAKSLSPILRRSSSGSYKELVELYSRLSKDDQDSIRIQIIPASTVFVELLPWDMKVGVHRPNILTPDLLFSLFFVSGESRCPHPCCVGQ